MAQATSRAASSRTSSRQSSGTRSGGSGNGASATGSSQNGSGLSRLKGAVVPVASVALGTAAGVVLGQMQAKRRKKVLGISIPGTGHSPDGLAKSIGEAGKQLARLADEVSSSRRKVEEVGKALQ